MLGQPPPGSARLPSGLSAVAVYRERCVIGIGGPAGTFDELGTPLSEVTFVVVDLETTGGSPASSAITEIGAVKVRGGELLGEFQTLVNPEMAVPPFIAVLTGITDAMVATRAAAARGAAGVPRVGRAAACWSPTTRRSTSGSCAPAATPSASTGPASSRSTPRGSHAGC